MMIYLAIFGDTVEIYFDGESTSVSSNLNEEASNEILNYVSNNIYNSSTDVETMKEDIREICYSYGSTDCDINIDSIIGEDQIPFIVWAEGDSMLPTIQNGQYVLVNKTHDIHVGDIVSVDSKEYGGIMKRVDKIDGDNVHLVSDNKNVYFKSRLVEGADPATVKAKKFPLFFDKKDYYYKGKGLNVANVKRFEVIKWSEDDMWAIDGKYAYYDSIRIDDVDLPSFKLQAHNCATDRNHVYRYGKILPLADPATYVEEWKGFYSRDKSHIWYLGELMEDVDIATFVVDDYGAHDKNGHFHRGERVTDEQWQQIAKENDQ